MPVSLAQAKLNAQTDLDVAVIDEFRKESVILDNLIFDDAVNPSGGGGTLVYGYRRLTTQPTADFRALNTEYAPAEVETTHVTVELAPLGGSFEVDRVIGRVGPAASGAVSLNLNQKIKATRTKFQDSVITGDVAVDANGFDGIDKAVTGTSTEIGTTTVKDWTTITTDAGAHAALDELDALLSALDGTPTMLIANARAMGRIRSIARRSGQHVREPAADLVGVNGRPIVRESFGGILFADPGDKAGTSTPIIPIVTRTIGVSTTGLTDIYAVRVGLDGLHGVSMAGAPLVQTWLPDFSSAKAVKTGEVEMGPVGLALKATKACAVLRNVKVQ